MIWPPALFGLGLVLIVTAFVLLSAQNDRLAKHQAAEDRLITDLREFTQGHR
jgi:hypothetical protein